IAGLAVMQASRVREIIDQRIERAGKAHEEAGQGECDPDMPLHGNAEEAGAALIFADRDHGAAERRAQNESHRADRQSEAEQHEEVEVLLFGEDVEFEEAKIDWLAREAAQAIVAPRQRTPLERD